MNENTEANPAKPNNQSEVSASLFNKRCGLTEITAVIPIPRWVLRTMLVKRGVSDAVMHNLSARIGGYDGS